MTESEQGQVGRERGSKTCIRPVVVNVHRVSRFEVLCWNRHCENNGNNENEEKETH